MMKNKNKFGQVWIETAIYTLIGLTIIAILLSAALPQIDKMRDQGTIKQVVNVFSEIDDKISQVEQAPGNIGIIYLSISKGKFEINPEEESIKYILEGTRLKLSEVGQEIREGNLILKTEKNGDRYNVILTRDYRDSLNITYSSLEEKKTLFPGTNPYKIYVENVGDVSVNEKVHINFNLF